MYSPLLWLLLSWHLWNVLFLSFSYVLILYYNITSHPSIFHLFSNFKYNLLSTFISFLSVYYRKLLELHNSKIYIKKPPTPYFFFICEYPLYPKEATRILTPWKLEPIRGKGSEVVMIRFQKEGILSRKPFWFYYLKN